MERGKKLLTALLMAMSLLILLTPTAFASSPPKTGCGPAGEEGHENDVHDWQFVGVETDKVVLVVWHCRKCGQDYCDPVANSMEEHKASGNHLYLNGWSITKHENCTATGEESRKCNICGEVETRERKALGHNWKTVITEPEGLKDGKKVTYCTRCNESETTVIPAAGGIFQTMRKAPAEVSELRITEQANGSLVSDEDGDVFRLNVGVEGGVGPYTYTWFRKGDAEETEPFTAVQDLLSKAEERSDNTLTKVSEAVAVAFKNRGVAMYGGKRDTAAKLPGDTLGTAQVSTGRKPAYEAHLAGDYYCRVTDSQGRTVVSEAVSSRLPLRIAEQPVNINMRDKKEDWFTVRADGGKQPYSYQWWVVTDDGTEESKIDGETNSTLNAVRRPGQRVFCIVTDSEGTSVKSHIARAYEADYLVLYRDADFVTLNEENPTYELGFKLHCCGVPPYTYEMFYCDLDTYLAADGQSEESLLESVYVSETTSETTFTYHVDKPGYYKCVAKDSYGQTAEDAIVITREDVHKIVIKNQPKGGKLKDDHTFRLGIEVEPPEGNMPKYYFTTMYSYNGETFWPIEAKGIYVTFFAYAIDVEEVGYYYFIVKDQDGNFAYSNLVSVESYIGPSWVRVTGTFEIIDEPFSLATLTAEVTGGEPPYRYDWRRLPDNYEGSGNPNDMEIPEANIFQDTETLYVTMPGRYIVNVKDSRGNATGWYDTVLTVTYSGSRPIITEQPANVLGSSFAGDVVVAWLKCSAMTNTNDVLRYEWVEPNPDGSGYHTIGYGQVWRSEEIKEDIKLGPYYCRVTNLRTGEQTLSQAGTIDVSFFEFTRAEVIADCEQGLRDAMIRLVKLEMMYLVASEEQKEILREEIAKQKELVELYKWRLNDLKTGGNP